MMMMIIVIVILFMNSFVINSYLIMNQQQQQQTKLHKRSTFLGNQHINYRSNNNNNNNNSNDNKFVMRDTSISYWFTKNDSVQVMDDVYIKNNSINLRGYIGTVIDTWEKCTIDPTCCCAEQVDINMAVRVQFGTESSTFTHYFAESELKKNVSTSSSSSISTDNIQVASIPAALPVVESTINQEEVGNDANTIIEEQAAQSVLGQQLVLKEQQQEQAFDGMSCVAYKLDQLQIDKRQRKIANYDPQQKNHIIN